MFPYPEWSMLVVAHSSKSCSRLEGQQGTLTLWQLPTATELSQGNIHIPPPFVKGVHQKQMVAATALVRQAAAAWAGQGCCQQGLNGASAGCGQALHAGRLA